MFVVNWKPKEFLLITLLLQSIFYVTVFFDIPVARQILGFSYFTFLPGFLILKLLKFDRLDGVETILLSVGFSVAFLMVAGLFINQFFFMFGILQPLSLVPLMVVLNSFILICEVLVYLRSENVRIRKSEAFEKSPFVLLLLGLPILSIIGATYVNIHGNNLLLLFMIILISVLLIIGVLSKNLFPSKLYPFAVLMISIALLYHSSLISNYIVPFGSDVPGEYFLFRDIESNAHWTPTLAASWGVWFGRMDSMLSITILPTLYTKMLNIDPILVFKMLYPIIFSFVPLGLYQIWQKYMDKKYAFISAFLFMSMQTFYTEMLGLNRQMISELFFVLLLLVILNKKMKPFNKMINYMIFSFALVTSHYSLAAIFLFFISFALVQLIVLKRSSINLTVPMIVFFLTIMFTWYIYTSDSATFNAILDFGDYVYRQLGDFFNLASRGQTVMTGLGLIESPSIWNTISRMFAYLTQVFIVFGFLGLVTKRTSARIEKQYLIFGLPAMLLLALLLVVPGLANTLNMTRFYHILLFFLAPLCVVGAKFIVELLSKREREFVVSTLLLIIIIPYFLFQTEFMFEVTGSDSWSIPLSGYRMSALRLHDHLGYTDAYSVYGAQWVSQNVDFKNSKLYADHYSKNPVLIINGLVISVDDLSNVTIVADNGIVYLSKLNVVDGMIASEQFSWNSSELSYVFDGLSTVYSNGGSEVYMNSR